MVPASSADTGAKTAEDEKKAQEEKEKNDRILLLSGVDKPPGHASQRPRARVPRERAVRHA